MDWRFDPRYFPQEGEFAKLEDGRLFLVFPVNFTSMEFANKFNPTLDLHDIEPRRRYPQWVWFAINMHNISVQELQRQVKEHTPLVEALARNLARKLPAHVDAADLVQDGHVALINSILSTSRQLTSAHFKNYLALRLHGAMLDGLRELDHGSRQLRKGMRSVELAIQRLGHRLGRMPLEHEVAMELGLSLRKYQRMLQDASDYVLISLDDIMEPGDDAADSLSNVDSDPLRVLERSALRESLATALKALSKQSSTVLRLYYVDDLKMSEIGLRLQCSEARVSQIHAQAIAELRARLLDGSGLIPVLKPRRSVRAR